MANLHIYIYVSVTKTWLYYFYQRERKIEITKENSAGNILHQLIHTGNKITIL